MNIGFESVGYLAGVCTAVSFIPQALQTFKTRDVKGLSVGTYMIFNLGMICWIIYGMYLQSIQMIVFNALCLTFSFPVLVMVYKYGKRGKDKTFVDK